MNKSIFNNWYKKVYYECWGFEGKDAPETAYEELKETFYNEYYLPLIFIASSTTKSWLKFKKELPSEEDAIDSLASISINEIFTYMNSLSIGLAWIPELPAFIKGYRLQPNSTVKDSLYNAWERYLKHNPVQLGWFGIRDDEIGKDVYYISTKPLLTYEESETYYGNCKVKSLCIPFISYDQTRINFARRVLKAYPEFEEYIPRRTVEQIVDGEAHEVDEVPVTALGTNGFPPIEAIQLYEVISNAEKSVYNTFTATINYHHSIGASVTEPVAEWLKSKEVLAYLDKYYKVPEDQSTVVENKIPVSMVLPPKKVKTEKQVVNKEEEISKEQPVQQDTTEIDTLRIALEERNKENTDLIFENANLRKELDTRLTVEREEELKSEIARLTTELEKSKDKYNKLVEANKASLRYDTELYDTSDIYRSALYALYLVRQAMPKDTDLGHNLNTAYFQSPLWLLAGSPPGTSLEDIAHKIEVDTHPNLELYEQLRKDLLKYIYEVELS